MKIDEIFAMFLHGMETNFTSLKNYIEKRLQSTYLNSVAIADNEFSFKIGFDKILLIAEIKPVTQKVFYKTYKVEKKLSEIGTNKATHLPELDITTEYDGLTMFDSPKMTTAMGREVDGTYIRDFGRDYIEQLLKVVS